jgi:hypothetical protein
LRLERASSLSARANHTRAICRKVARFCSSSAVCAIFKHSAANRRSSSDRDIESSPPFGTIGDNAERVYGVPYGLAGCGPFLRAMVQSLTLRRPCWAQRDSNRPGKPRLDSLNSSQRNLLRTTGDMPRPFVGTLGLLEVGLLLSMTASARRTPEEPKSPVSNESERHVSNYVDQDSTCIRWTDKCRTCNRSISADIVCSNIGIACQPAEKVECLERQQSDDKE